MIFVCVCQDYFYSKAGAAYSISTLAITGHSHSASLLPQELELEAFTTWGDAEGCSFYCLSISVCVVLVHICYDWWVAINASKSSLFDSL